MGSYDENGEWHSEMEDFWNYHGYANGPTQNSYSSYSSLTYNSGSNPDSGGGGGSVTVGDLLDALLASSNESVLSPWMQNYLSTNNFTSSQYCCPDLALQVVKGIGISAGTAVTTIGVVAQVLFSSAHVPEYAGRNYLYSNFGSRTFSISDIKTEAKSYPVRERMGQPGSYTITFEDGYKYHGKGPINRMFESALYRLGQHKRLVTSFDWTPSVSERESHKDEYRRMQRDKITPLYPEGYMNPINYNVIQSWGYLYIKQDGY